MTKWRWAMAAVLFLCLGVPFAWPFLEVVRQGEVYWTNQDLERLLTLSGNTLLLVAGTLAVALPVGIALAFLLYRTNLPGRSFFQFLVLLALFVPLPVLVSAWQALLGAEGWFPSVLWPAVVNRPWTAGLAPAIWIHALAALPWIILLVGQGLSWVEPELEEDSLLTAGKWRVLWRVTLPRCRGMIVAAGIWTALATAAEITVTDMMQVRTFAEEVHLQFTMGGPEALARAVLVSLPMILLSWLGLFWLVAWIDQALPPLSKLTMAPRPFLLGRMGWPCFLFLLGILLCLVGIPLASLFWKVGLQGRPLSWSAATTWARLETTLRLHGLQVGNGLLQAVLGGMLAGLLALVSCWVASESRWFRRCLFLLITLGWALPGPVIGIGLKEVIMQMVEWLPRSWLADWLYFGPSPLPGIWAYLLRFFPCAVVVLWPIVRLVPVELYELVRVEKGRPVQELCRVTWPLTWPAVVWISGIVTGLSLGEIAASNRVEPPRSETFAHLIFDRMHYGIDHEVAAPCLLLIVQIVLLGLLLALGKYLFNHWNRHILPAADQPVRPVRH